MHRLSTLTVASVLAAVLISVTAQTSMAGGDPNDPYQSGCANNSYVANSGVVRDVNNGQVMATFENHFSRSCNKNWGLVWWNGSGSERIIAAQIDVHTIHDGGFGVGVHHQCFPTSCNPNDFYTGGLSPAWTDMVEGTDVACLNGWVENGDYGVRLSVQYSHGDDNLCA